MAFFLKPKPAELILDDGNEGRTIVADRKRTILEILYGNRIAHPSDCRIGNCGTCAMQVIAGQVKSLTDPSYTLSAAEIADRFFLPCQSRVASDTLVVRRVQRPRPAPESETSS